MFRGRGAAKNHERPLVAEQPGYSELMEQASQLVGELNYAQAAGLYEKAILAVRKLPREERHSCEGRTRREYADICIVLGWWDRAERELRQVLDLTREMPPEQRVLGWLALGNLMANRGDPEQATTCFFSAQDLAEEHELGRELALTRCNLGSIAGRTGNLEEARSLIDQTLQDLPKLPEHPGNAELEAALWTQLGLYHFRMARLQPAESALQKALDLLPPSTLEEGNIRRYLGVIAGLRRKPKSALEFHMQALDIFLKASCIFGQAKVYESIGRTFLAVNRMEEAIHTFKKSEAICARLGANAELATLAGKLGQVYMLREDFATAANYFRRDLEISSRFRNYYTLGFSHRNLGRCLIQLGSLDEAISHLHVSLEMFRAIEETLSEGRVHMDLCQAHLRRSRPLEATGHCQRARSIFSQYGMHSELTFLDCLQASVARLSGDLSGAEEQLTAAIGKFAATGSSAWLAEAHHEMGILRLEQGLKAEAIEAFKEAVRTARQAGLNRESGRYLHELELLSESELYRTWSEGLEDAETRPLVPPGGE